MKKEDWHSADIIAALKKKGTHSPHYQENPVMQHQHLPMYLFVHGQKVKKLLPMN